MSKCKHCGHELGGEDIYESMKRHTPEKSEEELLEWAGHFGWTKENPTTFSNMIGIYDMYADGTTHFICPKCEKVVEKGTYWHVYKREMLKKGIEVQDP